MRRKQRQILPQAFEEVGNGRGILSWTSIIFMLFILSFSSNFANAALDVDNGVLGTPEVECGRDFVHFKVATKKAFRGRVYVKGEFDNPKCVQSMVEGDGTEEEGGNGEIEGANRRKGGSGNNGGGGGDSNGHGHHFGDAPVILDKTAGRKTTTGGGKADEDLAKGKGANRGGGVPEGEEEEEQHVERKTEPTGDEAEDEEQTIRQILLELQKRRNGNLDNAQRQIPSHFPGFSSAEQLKKWRSFLGGKPGLDGQGFRRYGSKLSPDANGECPLVCPPCDDCAKEFRKESLKRKRRVAADHSAELRVPLGECNTRRDRTANPPGMSLSLTVVVSFHPNFIKLIPLQFYITRVDRAYNIQCAYQEPERLLSTQIDVSPPPIIQISNQMQTPQCEYRIHGQSNSDQIRNVQVGDAVEHEWSCHGNAGANAQGDQQQQAEQQRMIGLFGLLIHDCFVDDGKSRRAQVLDSRGCSLDPQILPTPIYSPNSLRATVLSNVAKFPDGDLIGFQCSITVCMRELGRCDGITPPNCADSPALNSDGPTGLDGGNRTRERRSAEEAEMSIADWELNSPLLTVFDLTDQADGGNAQHEDFHHHRQPASPPSSPIAFPTALRRDTHSSFCVSVPMFAALVSLGTFISTISTGALLGVILFRDGLELLLKTK